MQDDDRSSPLVEAPEHLVDLVPVGQCAGHVRDRRRVDDGELDLDGPPLPVARLVDAGIDDESAEPGIVA